MGKSSAPAPMPDFAGIAAANAAAEQSRMQGQIAQQQLAWAKQQSAEDRAQMQPVIDRMIKGMDQQYDYAQEQKNFWDQNYKGLEEDFANQAQNWDTPERREREAGYAAADVAQQYEGARQAAAQQLKDFGVDPSSGRYAATDLASRVSQAASTAGAENMARRGVEGMGLQLKNTAINIGRGYPGAINATWQTGNQSGNSAGSNVMGLTQTGAQTMGTGTQWGGLSNQALGTWGSTAANNYGNYMEGYKFANTPRSSGIGSALGLIGGIGARMYMGAADGGAVPEIASPSRGAAVDDVPARVNVGEFIMPKEAVSWFGEKAMHDMILKAQKQREELEQQSGAVPDVAMAAPQHPTLASGAQPAALPMG